MTVPTVSSTTTGWRRFRPTVEPIMAALTFVGSLSSVVNTDLIIRQACRTYGLDVDNCTTNDKYEDTYDEVHKTVSTIGLYNIILSTLPGCFALMTTPWSQTNGRKPVLIVGVAGFTASQGVLAYLASLPDIDPYYFLLSAIPCLLTGGFILITVTITVYIIEISAPEDRSLRIAIVSGISLVATIGGSLLSPSYSALGYDVVFGTNTIVAFVCLLYVILFLPESIDVKKVNKKKFFTTAHIIDSCKSFFMKRPNHIRGIIIGLTIFVCFSIAIGIGESDVKYLSVKKEFGWTLSDFSTYNAVCQAVNAVVAFGGVYVGVTLLKIDEMTLIVAMQISITVGSTIMASVPTPTSFYVTSQLRCFNGCLASLLKGYMSRIVSVEEIAKVLSFANIFESFMPQMGSLVYSQFYNSVVETNPFSVYFLSSGFSIAQLLCAIVIWFMGRHLTIDKSEKPLPSERSLERPYDGNTSDNIGGSQRQTEDIEKATFNS